MRGRRLGLEAKDSSEDEDEVGEVAGPGVLENFLYNNAASLFFGEGE